MRPLFKGVLAILLVVFSWLVLASTQAYQSVNQQVRYQPDLPMTFAHIDHGRQGCLECHHNYGDETGFGLCMDCHVREVDISLYLEEQFHGLCRGCHEKMQIAGGPHGPIRSCAQCHTEDDKR